MPAFGLFWGVQMGGVVCMPRLPCRPPLCQVLFNRTTNQTWREHLSQWDNKPTDSLQWQNALERVKNGQLQATGNPALINKMSYSQKEEINSSSTNWEDRREEHSITVAWESLSYSELIFTERCPCLLCVQTAKKVGEWGDCSKRGSLSEVVNNHCN